LVFVVALFSTLLPMDPLRAQPADGPTTVTIPGTIQSVLGCSGDWQPDCAATALQYDPAFDLWSAVFSLPAGAYEYKVALNGRKITAATPRATARTSRSASPPPPTCASSTTTKPTALPIP
jgi:hypothetical protein